MMATQTNQTQAPAPSVNAIKAAREIVNVVNLDSGRKLNDQAAQSIAAIIEREAMTTPAAASTPTVNMTEAPYSWNVTAQDPSTGFIEQFTVRAITPEGFIQRVGALKVNLIERGYTPAPRNGHGAALASEGAAQGTGNESEKTAWCEIHSTEMKPHSGNGENWFSHKAKTRDGKEYWCKGKPPKS